MDSIWPILGALGGAWVVGAVIGVLLFFAPILIWLNVRQSKLEARRQTAILERQSEELRAISSAIREAARQTRGPTDQPVRQAAGPKTCPECGKDNAPGQQQCYCGHQW